MNLVIDEITKEIIGYWNIANTPWQYVLEVTLSIHFLCDTPTIVSCQS